MLLPAKHHRAVVAGQWTGCGLSSMRRGFELRAAVAGWPNRLPARRRIALVDNAPESCPRLGNVLEWQVYRDMIKEFIIHNRAVIMHDDHGDPCPLARIGERTPPVSRKAVSYRL